MTDTQFNELWCAALTAADRDAYVSDWATSSIWHDAETDAIPAERIEAIGQIYDVAHMSVRDIREATGLTQAAFAIQHCIPRRSIQNWETGQRTCPDYIRLMLAQTTGAYHRP